MTYDEVMLELAALGTERTKRVYQSNGAHEPLFGVATGDMKAMAKKIKRDQPLAEQLYQTGNYDAMYFAGMICDPKAMTLDDFERWIDAAYFYMLSDFVVAVSLAESDFAQEVADRWIDSGEEMRMSAGWACYEWLLGWKKDDAFDEKKIRRMLEMVEKTIHDQPNRTRYAMNGFLAAVGVSFKPLHEEALRVADAVGSVYCETAPKKKCAVPEASETIRKALEKGRIGFKRKAVRC